MLNKERLGRRIKHSETHPDEIKTNLKTTVINFTDDNNMFVPSSLHT